MAKRTKRRATAKKAALKPRRRASRPADRRPPAPAVPESAAPITPDAAAWRAVNRVQLGELMGVHPDTVTDYSRQGMPVVTLGGAGREGVYDAVDCLTWWRSRQGKNLKESAQARAYQANAELNELKLQRERGELLERDKVILEGQAYTKAWAAMVRAIANRLLQAGLVRREDVAGVNAISREILNEIANWKTPGDLKRAGEKDAA